MFTQDLHTHSNFCDGKNSPEEMVLSAIEKGLKRIGICAHSPVAFEKGGFLPEDRFGKFQKEISRLKDKYKDRIEVLCGIELTICPSGSTNFVSPAISSSLFAVTTELTMATVLP